MTDPPFHRFSAFVDLTDGERAAMRDMIERERPYGAAERIRVEGDRANSLFFLHEGWALSSITHPDGSRQVLKVHRSGDVMGAPSLPFELAVESLVALTPSKVGVIPLGKFGALFTAHPRLGTLLFLSCQEERVTLMDRLAIGGQLGARHGVAAFLLMIFDQKPPSDRSDDALHIPLTQAQVGEAVGLSTVHVNRVMASLQKEGLIERSGSFGHTIKLPDLPRLREFVGMQERVRRRNPAWLPRPAEH